MAKRVTLLPESVEQTGNIIGDNDVIEIGGVRYTADSAKNPSVLSNEGADKPEIFPIVDSHNIIVQDANDGTQDGNQKPFELPPFANGRDLRYRG